MTAPDGGARDAILVDIKDAIAFVTLSNPARLNAITVRMWRNLTTQFSQLSSNLALRCVVLRGAGGNFASGADISEFPHEWADRAGVLNYHLNIIAPALRAVAECVHPVVAQIRGVCVGGGLEIASQCDLRISARSARFGVPINQLGFPMAPHEMQGLLRLIGRASTLELLLEGRVFDADEALAKGLLNRVLDDDHLDEHLDQLVQRVAAGAPLAARINKKTAALLTGAGAALDDAAIQELFTYAESNDHREGVNAFLAGRKPVFHGV